jgi:hypothetical protein
MQCVKQWMLSGNADYGQIACFIQSWRGILPSTIPLKPLYIFINQILDEKLVS